MQVHDKINFLEYLGLEEQNLLTSLTNFKLEMDLLYDLDQIFQAPVKRLEITSGDFLPSQLYLFVHYHLYFSISCLFRCHLAEAFFSVRKAIDATLTAYKIILEPDTAEKYINGDNYFKYIKANIKKERIKDPHFYPLADALIKVYDACSKYGAHADLDSFAHRRELKEYPEKQEKRLLFHYFQKPKDTAEFQSYIVITLQGFLSMFLVFKIFFDKKLKIIDPNWENTINKVKERLDKMRQTIYPQIIE